MAEKESEEEKKEKKRKGSTRGDPIAVIEC
jgi:hypothetical protein